MPKKIISILLSLCFVIGLFGAMPAKKASAGSQENIYVAIGDSIAAGYGLAGYADEQSDVPADSYPALVGDFLKTKPVNGAISGITLQEGIDMLKSGSLDASLKKADVITISLGSNDLLKPFMQSLATTFQLDPAIFADGVSDEEYAMLLEVYESYGMLGILTKLSELSEVLASNALLKENMENLDSRYDQLFSLLEEKKASDSQIYITNIYNPYSEVAGLSDMIEPYIQTVNQVIAKKSKKYGLIDVYSAFAKKNETNVHFDLQDTSKANFDPHPSKSGHATIAGLVINAIKQANTPMKPVLKKASISKKGKLSVNIKKVKNASGYEISYSTSLKGKLVKLKRISKNSASFKVKRFKKKKTYYISVRCYSMKKGVTYYSEYSNAMKVKMK